jgi:hypothetical protein
VTKQHLPIRSSRSPHQRPCPKPVHDAQSDSGSQPADDAVHAPEDGGLRLNLGARTESPEEAPGSSEAAGDTAARAQFDEKGVEIDPRAAERMIRAVYTDEEIDDIDTETLVGNQIFLLTALIADEGLDGAGLNAFLTKARKLADEWID